MQAEIFDDGGFEYRYDLLRMSNMNALTLSFSPIGWQNCVLRLDEYGTE